MSRHIKPPYMRSYVRDVLADVVKEELFVKPQSHPSGPSQTVNYEAERDPLAEKECEFFRRQVQMSFQESLRANTTMQNGIHLRIRQAHSALVKSKQMTHTRRVQIHRRRHGYPTFPIMASLWPLRISTRDRLAWTTPMSRTSPFR